MCTVYQYLALKVLYRLNFPQHCLFVFVRFIIASKNAATPFMDSLPGNNVPSIDYFWKHQRKIRPSHFVTHYHRWHMVRNSVLLDTNITRYTNGVGPFSAAGPHIAHLVAGKTSVGTSTVNIGTRSPPQRAFT